MEDFLGRTFGPGDTVVYPAQSGRSVNMVKARVISINPSGTVTVQPLMSARWEQHSGQTRYVDGRTGKGIDPNRGTRHVETAGHYRNTRTGATVEWVPYADWRVWRERDEYVYVPTKFKDYVTEKHEDPKPVALKVTKNIVRVDDLPESEEAA